MRALATTIVALAAACGSANDFGSTGNGETMAPAESSGSGTGGPSFAVCGEEGAHSFVDEIGACWCEPGYTWIDRYDPRDFGCTEVAPRMLACAQRCDASAIALGELACDDVTQEASCDCADGESWCSDDSLDTRCCVDPAQPQPGRTSTDTGTSEGSSSDVTDAGTSSSSSTSSSDGSSGGTTATGTSEQ